MATKDPTHMLWFDYETSGLWSKADEPPVLMEMAALLLPYKCFDPSEALFEVNMVFKVSNYVVQSMDSFVVDMHTKNGLLKQSIDAYHEPHHAEDALMHGLKELKIGRFECAPAGSGIAPFDCPLMRIYMFDLYNYLHYAPYDIGGGRRFMRMFANMESPEEDSNHRAMDDLKMQLREAQWWEKQFTETRSPKEIIAQAETAAGLY